MTKGSAEAAIRGLSETQVKKESTQTGPKTQSMKANKKYLNPILQITRKNDKTISQVENTARTPEQAKVAVSMP